MRAKQGYFGEFGGSFVPPQIQAELLRIDEAYKKLKNDSHFKSELRQIQRDFQGRPTPLYLCRNLTEQVGGAKIYLKREDLNHTGAHKINHCMGELLLARHLGKTKVLAETGAGQHGLALATAAAYFGMECEIHMGQQDIDKQQPNVAKMKLLGCTVVPVTFGQQSLKEAVDSCFVSYMEQLDNAIYCIGSAVGPHPFPTLVRDFQSIIGREAKQQHKREEGCLPDAVVACVGGGSNAIGLFQDFIKESSVQIYGVEPHGGATLNLGQKSTLHGFESITLLNNAGEPSDISTIASGLHYPGVGPQHAHLASINRAKYVTITDKEALEAFYTLSRVEGIIPALESAHAVAYGMKLARELGRGKTIIINLSGRGDKDLDFVFENSERILQ